MTKCKPFKAPTNWSTCITLNLEKIKKLDIYIYSNFGKYIWTLENISSQ